MPYPETLSLFGINEPCAENDYNPQDWELVATFINPTVTGRADLVRMAKYWSSFEGWPNVRAYKLVYAQTVNGVDVPYATCFYSNGQFCGGEYRKKATE